jgi:integrase/recombinase XerD
MIPYNNTDIILRKPVEHIRLDEAEAIKRACDTIFEKTAHSDTDKFVRDRDKLLLTLMWVTGARISDVLAMSSENVNIKEKTITFLVKKRKDKTRKDTQFWHTISLDMETLLELVDYSKTWEIKGILFPAYIHSKNQITRQTVNIKLNKLASLAGVRKINPHMYRHGIAVYMQSQGCNAETIAFRLAHSSTSVTLNFYARMNAAQERSILDSMNIRLR